ncbi:glycosyltransferase [Parvularcula dongshanensis]|uniref:Glycosyltransferase n=1 Tax=Parvularcula dongshanensis TaxID=1173995 RepID=A0A840I2G4_9PROT|nr:glycosyltransferase [Parvularcula dongshanensis]MBB4658424.1 hypothetical protein [Parvularcula dongshanensis]
MTAFLSPRWIVALPARNEAERLPAALCALDLAAAGARAQVGVLVFANGCEDDTAAIARRMACDLSRIDLAVVEADLPSQDNHAGGARRASVEAARHVFGAHPQDLLFTTDADAQLAQDAFRLAEGAFDGAADLVLARIDCIADPFDPAPEAALAWGTPAVLWRHKVRTLAETVRTGQVPYPPLHDDYGGAGIAIRFAAYDALGGFASVPFDEDKRLVLAADRAGLRVDRACGFAVSVYTRMTGRAVGGMATALAQNVLRAAQNAPCLVERHDMTLARLLRDPSHASAFTDEPAALEPVEAAIHGLDAAMARYAARPVAGTA